MSEAALPEIAAGQELDTFLAGVPVLRDYLPVARVERVGHGQSNITLRIWLQGGRSVILRRPPAGPLPPRAHEVLREHRVMYALRESAVPVPRMLARCEDLAVLGVPFYLMEMLDGDAIRFEVPPSLDDGAPIAWRRSIGEQVIDALAALHTIDPTTVGLADLGHASTYLARQLKRWKGQLEFARVRPVDDLDWATDWLDARLPPQADSTSGRIVHGDYKLDNALFSFTEPPCLVAVVDWEMATLGDPLADLGWLLAFWQQAGDAPPELKIIPRVTEASGFSTRAELVERYASQTGQPVSAYLRFYVVLALWKMAVLLEGHWARHVRGTAAGFDFAYLEVAGPKFWRRIRDIALATGPDAWVQDQ